MLPAANGQGLDFDALLQRIHPAESRVTRLATKHRPVSLPSTCSRSMIVISSTRRYSVRLQLLRGALKHVAPPIYACPSTTDATHAQDWFVRFEGAGLDGVVAKRLSDPYTPDKRTLVKVKHIRSAECAVAGYRVHKDGKGVGSLLLGLHDETGRLHHVGVTAAFTAAFRGELLNSLRR